MSTQSSVTCPWLLLVLLGVVLLSVPALAGMGVVEAQDNASNDTEDDGFGLDIDENLTEADDVVGNETIDSDSPNLDDRFSLESNESLFDGNESDGTESGDTDPSIDEEAAEEETDKNIAEEYRNEALSTGRSFIEQNVPYGEEAGDVYDTADELESDIGNTVSGMQSPGEWVHSAVTSVTTYLFAELAAAINLLHEYAVQVPAPGEAEDPSSWVEPDDQWWAAVYSAIAWPLVIGVMWLLAQVGVSFSYDSAEKRRRGWKRIGFAGLMVFGTWVFAPLLLHLFAELAAEVYPDGEEFTTPDGAVRFGLGVYLLLILLLIKSVIVVMAIISIFVLELFAYLSVLFWPLMWAAWASHGQVRAYGSLGIYIFGSVLTLSLVQSVILRFLVQLPFGQSVAGTAGSMLLIMLGLAIALVYLPMQMLKKAHVASAVKLGSHQVDDAMRQAPSEVREIARQYKAKYDHWGDDDSTDEAADPDTETDLPVVYDDTEANDEHSDYAPRDERTDRRERDRINWMFNQ